MAATTIHDTLTLKVVSDGKERRIVSSGADPTKYVSKNGQNYYDGVWRVRLYDRDDPGGGLLLMALISYHGHKTAKRNTLRGKHVCVNTGLLQMCLKKTVLGNGAVKDELELELTDLDGV